MMALFSMNFILTVCIGFSAFNNVKFISFILSKHWALQPIQETAKGLPIYTKNLLAKL